MSSAVPTASEHHTPSDAQLPLPLASNELIAKLSAAGGPLSLQISEPNKFGVRLIDASSLPNEHSEAFSSACSDAGSGMDNFALLVPRSCAMPAKFRFLTSGDRVTDVQGHSCGFSKDTKVVVSPGSSTPHILDGKKGAMHIALTVEVDLPANMARSIKEQRGTPLSLDAFQSLTDVSQAKVGEATEKVSFFICGKELGPRSHSVNENTFSSFGGSAIVIRNTTGDGDEESEPLRLESTREILQRTVSAQAGTISDLLSDIIIKPRQQITFVSFGGKCGMLTNDSYAQGISRGRQSLMELKKALDAARPDGVKVSELAIVPLPAWLGAGENHVDVVAKLDTDWFGAVSEGDKKGLMPNAVMLDRVQRDSRGWVPLDA